MRSISALLVAVATATWHLLLPPAAHAAGPQARAISTTPSATPHTSLAPARAAVSEAIDEHARRVLNVADHGDRPFAIVDKRAAVMAVYRGDGVLAGVTTVLLGLTPGDLSTEGVGQRTQTGQLRIEDRTTPAGRFDSQPGRNLSGEAIVWIDYGAALAIHRLRHGAGREGRLQRMASSDPRDKRISAGCVVVPEAFYDGIVHPLLGQARGVVYVMPESGQWPQSQPPFPQQQQFLMQVPQPAVAGGTDPA